MANPRVCAILLTADRQAMAKRALRCFENQTEAHLLFILDSGNDCFFPDHQREVLSRVEHHRYTGRKQTIGELRNIASDLAIKKFSPDILAHFDDDDYSAPTRLAEQVQHLQASGADAVGYSDLLFWRRGVAGRMEHNYNPPDPALGEAWLHNNHKPNYALGTSLCYWRRVWEAKPFPDMNGGCDDLRWVEGLKVVSVSSLREADWGPRLYNPMMVAEIHGSNTCARISTTGDPRVDDWTRVPEWDEKLRGIMAL